MVFYFCVCKCIMFPVPKLEVDAVASLFGSTLQGYGKPRLILKWHLEED